MIHVCFLNHLRLVGCSSSSGVLQKTTKFHRLPDCEVRGILYWSGAQQQVVLAVHVLQSNLIDLGKIGQLEPDATKKLEWNSRKKERSCWVQYPNVSHIFILLMNEYDMINFNTVISCCYFPPGKGGKVNYTKANSKLVARRSNTGFVEVTPWGKIWWTNSRRSRVLKAPMYYAGLSWRLMNTFHFHSKVNVLWCCIMFPVAFTMDFTLWKVISSFNDPIVAPDNDPGVLIGMFPFNAPRQVVQVQIFSEITWKTSGCPLLAGVQPPASEHSCFIFRELVNHDPFLGVEKSKVIHKTKWSRTYHMKRMIRRELFTPERHLSLWHLTEFLAEIHRLWICIVQFKDHRIWLLLPHGTQKRFWVAVLSCH